MRRYNQSADFTLNHFAEKVPIHYRSSGSLPNRKGIAPATAFVHDLAGPEFGTRDDDIGGIRMTKSAPLSPNAHKPPVFLPGDRVIFAESPSAPGIPVVYRTPEERTANPDRLNLDRRRLSVCPILEGEDQLRLLNYQHNLISKIQHLAILRRLIFLDLYDNQIEEISGLSTLKSLRVLMLGKNRIKTIQNLDNLIKLDVLDLHGNQIKKIQNLCHLTELRVLNLAGNQILHVDDLSGLDSLAELNLRRNSIKTVIDVDNLHNLQRLFLSFNEIQSFDDIACLGDSHSISELSLDGNPIAQDQYYKQVILRRMQQLKQLDMKRISEEERRIAMLVARKEEDKKRELTKTAIMKEKRRLAINNAKRQWEVNQGTMINKSGKLRTKMPDLYASHLATYSNPDLHSISPQQDIDDIESNTSDRLFSRPTSAHSVRSANTDGSVERSRPGSRRDSQSAKVPLKETKLFGSNGDVSNLADLNGDTLSMYGQQSLEALDKNWGIQAAGAVTTLVFKFIDFNDISKHLHKIRTRFPGVQTLIFSANSISTLQQLNALSNVRRLDNLTIETDGNPVTKFVMWKMYILFRLAHFAMKKINDVEVTASDIVNAEKLFGPLSHITTSQLPQSRLLSLLGETRKKHLLNYVDEKGLKKTGEGRGLDKMQGEFVGRAGLIYYPPGTHKTKLQEQQPKRTFGRNYVSELIRDTIFTEKKRTELIKIWPQMFYEMVHNAVTDMEDLQAYMKKCTEELERG